MMGMPGRSPKPSHVFFGYGLFAVKSNSVRWRTAAASSPADASASCATPDHGGKAAYSKEAYRFRHLNTGKYLCCRSKNSWKMAKRMIQSVLNMNKIAESSSGFDDRRPDALLVGVWRHPVLAGHRAQSFGPRKEAPTAPLCKAVSGNRERTFSGRCPWLRDPPSQAPPGRVVYAVAEAIQCEMTPRSSTSLQSRH